MKVLVIGSGGREHALAWRLAKTPGLQHVFVAPGNAGTAREHELQNVNITDPTALADYSAGMHMVQGILFANYRTPGAHRYLFDPKRPQEWSCGLREIKLTQR